MKMCLGAQLYTVRDYMKTEADYRMMMKKLAEIGYVPTKMRAVDMFPRTGHVETVICLIKN